MKWFHIYFDSSYLSFAPDKELFKNFLKLYHKSELLNGLALYQPLQKPAKGLEYYISTPDELQNEIKEILSNFNSYKIDPPNLNSLEIVAGNNNEFEK